MDDKITIIEGPPPNFEDVHEGWPLGLNESPSLHKLAMTRLRTFNGPSLVERCYRTWHSQQTIQLGISCRRWVDPQNTHRGLAHGGNGRRTADLPVGAPDRARSPAGARCR